MKKIQVIIVGAGPSGVSAALTLYNLGIKNILVIDKESFPRYKCCAGYITNKTKKSYQEFGLNISKCHYSLIDDFKIYYNGKNKQTIVNKFLYTNRDIDRVELDYNFFKLLKRKNISVLENTKIIKSDFDNNKLLLSNKEEYTFDYLIFADGTSGYGSTFIKRKRKNIALQAIFPTNKSDGIEIHFNITKHGYAWISTFKGKTNVGITDIYKKNVNYNEILKNFIKDNNMQVNDKDIRGAFTPIGITLPIINNNIYFIGDAVGGCDPFTLSGLRYGITTGKLCAQAIKENNNKIYTKYLNILKIKFKLMYILQRIFYFKPISFLIFNVGCTLFKPIISACFNHFFVNKK